jgi:hypothetical protein
MMTTSRINRQSCAHRIVWGFAAAWGLVGCEDQVVGQFDSSMTNASASDGDAGGGTTAAAGETSGSTSEPEGFMPPGCFGDAFEGEVLDAQMWNTWTKEDAAVEQRDGVLVFTPATFGLNDSGIVSSHRYVFPFDDARARVRVPLPPDPAHPVLLFLAVSDKVSGHTVSVHLHGGQVTIDGRVEGMPATYSESFVADPYPAWIALRSEDGLVHHEISDDGSSWTTLGSYEKLSSFETASVLVMAQTYADHPTPAAVKADDLEVCVGQ